MRQGSRGFTLIELLITIGILAVVMSLLAYPIISAYSYIQKSQARTEARSAADAAIKQIQHDLSQAAYIFDIAPDGSMVPFALATDGEILNTNGHLKLMQYMQVLDFPWGGQSRNDQNPPWGMLHPNYLGQLPSYHQYYTPFWHTNASRARLNPYYLGRYEFSAQTWAKVSAGVVNGLAPLTDTDIADPAYAQLLTKINNPGLSEAERGKYISMLRRTFHNAMIPVTPLNAVWDVPQFQAVPLRIAKESMTIITDGNGTKMPIAALARYPMWAGRNLDHETLEATSFYTNLPDYNASLYRRGINPFGFQIHVFDSDGGLLTGMDAAGQYQMRRHYRDWPAIDRPDWDNGSPLWTKAEIDRQRLEGKVVFVQPMVTPTATLNLSDPVRDTRDDRVNFISQATLPIPVGNTTGWTDNDTYLVEFSPHTLRLKQGSSDITFRRVMTREEQEDGTFYVPPFGTYFNSNSRVVEFSSTTFSVGVISASPWIILDKNGNPIKLQYTICDLQPTDVVVATYSTKGVLDIVLTVSRQDSTGGSARQRRQDYTAKFRVTAENALVKARSSR